MMKATQTLEPQPAVSAPALTLLDQVAADTATRGDNPVDRKPFIVTLAGPVADFRVSLERAIPDAALIGELSGHRVVVVLPAERQTDLAQLPAVTSVVPDELRQTRRPGGP
jgi:hypothetical protein